MTVIDSEDLEEAVGEDGVIAQLMDIREPLQSLRLILQTRFNADLSDYDFWLQVAFSMFLTISSISLSVEMHNRLDTPYFIGFCSVVQRYIFMSSSIKYQKLSHFNF